MTGTSSAINLLLDATLTVQGTTGGDDGNTSRSTSGTAATILADRVTCRSSRSTADHSAGAQGVAHHRTQKLDWTIDVEAKLEKKASADLLARIIGSTGVVVRVIVTATGANVTGTGIVTSVDIGYDMPSTLRFTLQAYGTDMTITTT